MNEQPLISIIVPVYNVEQYLAQCLDSILNQTYQNIEIICVNDGSSDNSLEILYEYTKHDLRVKVINKENRGVSEARNSGLKISDGDLLMFVDADDWIEADTCEKAVTAMNNHQADVVMWSYVSEYGNASNLKEIFKQDCTFECEDVKAKLHRRFVGLIGSELAHPEMADSLCPVWGKLYKKELIMKSGSSFIDLADIGTYEDGLFNLDVFYHVRKAVYINECLYHYRRQNTSSVTSVYNEKLPEQWQNLFGYMKKYIDNHNLPEEYSRALDNRIALSILGLGLNIVSADFSARNKIKAIREILCQNNYRKAYRNLEFQYFPIHWKLFYWYAKHQIAGGVYLLLIAIQKIIAR